MTRENPERAKEYKKFEIASCVESEWRKEEFERRLEEFHLINPNDYRYFLSSLHILIDRNEDNLVMLYELVWKMRVNLPPIHIDYFLSTIIGNNTTRAKRGLIQKSFDLELGDLAYKFYTLAKNLIIVAEENEVIIPFTRGNLKDLITYYQIEEDERFIIKLMQKDNADNFIYYKQAAEEGNNYEMKMLSDCYRDGKGCEPDTELALYWINKAKSKES